jgi:hypothetical protein
MECRRRSGVPEPAEEVPRWLFCGEPLAGAELAQVAQDIDGALKAPQDAHVFLLI